MKNKTESATGSMTKDQSTTIPAPGQVIIVLDGHNHPIFIVPKEVSPDDQRPLSADESASLAKAKATLLKHAEGFQAISSAINNIHTARLYRNSHRTCTDFLLTFLGFRPATFDAFINGRVPVALEACKPSRAVWPAKAPQSISSANLGTH